MTVTGDPDFLNDGADPDGPCPYPAGNENQIPGNESIDAAGVVDTPAERANNNTDDNVATVNLLCREITLRKDVCYDGDDPDLDPDPGRCTDANSRRLSLPAGPFPMNVVYRYTVTNEGEITESVSIRECFVLADAESVGATVLRCDLIENALNNCLDRPGCGSASAATVELSPDAPNNTATLLCVFQFPTRQSLENFLELDDGRDICGDGVPAPADPQCYRNCAEACAEAKSDACPGGPLDRVTSTVDVCYTPCEIEVRKEVRCLDNCVVPADPNAGWVRNLPVLPGACLQYRLVVTNTGDPNNGVDLCAIDLNDTLGNPDIFAGLPFDVQIVGSPYASVTPDIRQPANAAALINGTTIQFRNGLLQNGGRCVGEAGTPAPGSSFVITFRLNVKTLDQLNAINNFNPSTNGVSVRGSSTCAPTPVFDCEDLVNVIDTRCERRPEQNADDNTATVDPFRPSLTCEKSLVRYQWDCNTDCDPTNDPFTNFGAPVASPDGPVYTDLMDKVFPVIVEYRIRITNNGETCLRVTANDTDFAADVAAAPGVDFVAGQNQLGQQRDIQPGDSSDWLFQVRFDTAEAARAFAARDDGRPNCRNVLPDRFIYRNCADITATVCPGGNFCYPPTPITLGAGDGCFAQLEFPPCPTITVVKEVKCYDAPDTAYAESATGLPGSRFRFRVRITNTSTTVKIPKLCIRDVFDECGNAAQCAAWLANPPPYTAVLRRAGGGAPVSITACLPSSIINNPNELCFNLRDCGLPSPDCGALGRWLAPGDLIEITFDVRAPVDPAAYLCNDPIDLRNTIRARAYADVCDGSNWCDEESDFATIDIKKPQVTCAKEICWDRNADGQCSGNESFTNALDLPCDAMRASQDCGQCAPRDLSLIYRFRVTNPCDVPLVNVRICDDQLVADVLAAGGSIDSCDLCDGPCDAGGNDNCTPTFTLAPGATVERFCRIRFTTVAQWLAFAALDSDNDRHCYTNTARTEAQVDTAGLCISGAVTTVTPSECSASVCLAPTDIEVRKQVRCLPNCTTQGIGPEEGWVDDLQIVPGACLQWRIIVTNASPDVPICAVRMRDEFRVAACGDIFTGLPFDVQVVGPVPPWGSIVPDIRQPANAGLLIDNTCIVFSSGTLDPGEAFTVLFRRDVNPLADFPACYGQVIENNVSVEGAGECPGGVPAYCSCDTADIDDTAREIPPPPRVPDSDDDNDTKVHPRRPSLTCQSKTWAFQQDTNADCEPDGPFSAQVRDLDLSNAMFPVILRLRITALNDGDVPLQVTPSDPELINCVNITPGVNFLAGCELNPPVTKCVCPGQSAVWECLIRVETAEAGRQLALCDTAAAACNDGGQLPDAPRRYRNRALMNGVMVGNCNPACPGNLPSICIPPPPNNGVPGRDACCATVLFPPECQLEVTKDAVCVDNCSGGNPVGPVQTDVLEVTPGACVRYIVTIRNAGPVAIKRLRLRDTYPCGGVSGLRAELLRGGVGAPIDVTACFDTGMFNLPTDYTFDCLATDRFMAPTDVLRITFDAQAPADATPFCLNTMSAQGYTEVCTPQGAPERPCIDDDNVRIDLRRPGVTCVKEICLDRGLDGTCNPGDPRSTFLQLEDEQFPLQLLFIITVTNSGQLPLTNIEVCDDNLLADVAAAGAGVSVTACDLVGACVTLPGPLAPGATATVTCAVRFDDPEAYERFARTDGDGDDECYRNTARVNALGQPGNFCGVPVAPPESQCEARVCVPPPAPCPPIVKIKFDIWNQNEVRFSGAERCIQSWLCLPLSEWIQPPTPNFFQRSLLGTNAGKARIGGEASTRCNRNGQPDSIDSPLLGVAVNVLEFQNFPGGSRVEKAGSPLVGTLPTNRRLPGYVGEFDGPPSPAGVPASFDTAQVSQRGSAIAFVKVEIKWDWQGRLIQDTFIELTNDNNIAVNAHLWFINGSARDCNWSNNTITLTANEPSYWAASTGLPKGVSPFTVLGDGEVDDDPRNRNPADPNQRGRVLRGYVIAHAVNDSNVEINWPYLMGRATIVNYAEALAWEYEPWVFAAVAGQNTGTRNDPARVLLTPYLKLDFDGAEYQLPPSQLILNFYASGSHPFDRPNQPINTETELTIWAAIKQLGQP